MGQAFGGWIIVILYFLNFGMTRTKIYVMGGGPAFFLSHMPLTFAKKKAQCQI
jgi:hypothetical protein